MIPPHVKASEAVRDATSRSGRLWHAFLDTLPKGSTLPDNVWVNRHKWFRIFLWAHALALPFVGVIFGRTLSEGAVSGLIVAAFAVLAGSKLWSRRVQAVIVSLGFGAASGFIVHLSGGYIEMHFHYFVMVTFLTLYQDWVPFLVSIAFVGAQHGTMGWLLPHSVYNHPDAILHPWRWASIHAAFLGAACAGCVIAWRNIERGIKRAEEARVRLAAIVESSNEAIIGETLEGAVVSWNTAAEQLLGYAAHEVLGAPAGFLIPPSRLDEERLLIKRLQLGERVEHVETVRRSKKGYEIHVALTISPIREPNGRIVGFSKIMRDITDRKRSEEEIKLRSIQLEALNKELEAFSYSVSHDLRAPLRHIDGFADLLQKDAAALDEKGRRYLGMISDSAKQMGRLIDDLLVFSRMGRGQINKTQVKLDHLVNEVILEMRPDLESRSIDWAIAPLPAVQADPNMLRQVWINLIGNAVKYTRDRHPAKIEIGTLPSTDGEQVVFIRDNGAGFDMKYADKLFGVFQRLHRADEFEGTGIGLANVRRIVTRHGGRVWAEGEVEKGATFYVSLPQ